MSRSGNISEILVGRIDSDAANAQVDRIDPTLFSSTSSAQPGYVLTVTEAAGGVATNAKWQPTGAGVSDTTLRQTPSIAVDQTYDPNWRSFLARVGYTAGAYDSELRIAYGVTTSAKADVLLAAIDSEIEKVGLTLYTGVQSPLASQSQIPIGITVNDAGVISLQYPTTFNATPVWAITNQSSKNAYTNRVAGTINTSDIRINFTVGGGSTFSTTNTDSITITVRGTGVSAQFPGPFPQINGQTSGFITITSSQFPSLAQTDPNIDITTRITLSNGTIQNGTDSISNTQPVPFAITGISSYFNYDRTGNSPAIVPFYVSALERFIWSYTATGTTVSGSANYQINAGATNAIAFNAGGGTVTGNFDITNASTYTLNITATGNGLFGDGVSTSSRSADIVKPAGLSIYRPWFFGTSASAPITVASLETMSGEGGVNNGNVQVGIGVSVNRGAALSTDRVYVAVVSTVELESIATAFGPQAVPTPSNINLPVAIGPGAGGTIGYRLYDLGQVGSATLSASYTFIFSGTP